MRKAGETAAIVALMSPVSRATGSASKESDEFEYRGYRVRWSGWRHPDAQRFTYGFWSADKVVDASGEFVYATTLGVVRRARRLEQLDLGHAPGAKVLDGTHTPADESAAKASARRLILADLEANA